MEEKNKSELELAKHIEIVADYLARVVNFYIHYQWYALSIEQRAEVSNCYTVMQDVFARPSSYFSQDVIKGWISAAAAFSRKNEFDFHASLYVVKNPAQVVFDTISPCLMDEDLAHIVQDFIVMLWTLNLRKLGWFSGNKCGWFRLPEVSKIKENMADHAVRLPMALQNVGEQAITQYWLQYNFDNFKYSH